MFFPKVIPGAPFRPSAVRENAITDLLNRFFITNGMLETTAGSSVRVPVFNSGNATISSGSAVNVVGSPVEKDYPSPCLPFFDESLPWGVLANSIDPQECGSCIVSGPANVQISGTTGNYAKPDTSNPEVFVLADTGIPVISKGNGFAVINLGGGSNAIAGHQFTVADASSDDVVKVRVYDGNGSGIAGVLNGATYAETTLELNPEIPQYWVYAVNGSIYALNHEFSSDLFPTLLCATVTVADGGITIVQKNFDNNINVPVISATYGVTTITGTLSYADYVLTATYTISSSVLCNFTKINSGTLNIPVTAEGTTGYLLAYVDKLVVDTDTPPTTGFEFVAGSPEPSIEREWYQKVLEYTLTATSFSVAYRLENPYLFTFTQLYVNANEVNNG